MKNNTIIKTLFVFYFIFFHLNNLFAKDLNIKAFEILTYDEGNLIIGNKDAEAVIDGELEIYADKFTYDRKKEILVAEGNVETHDIINNIKLKSNKISYDKIKNIIISFGESNFFIKEKYKIKSANVYFLMNELIIYSDEKTKFQDGEKNNIQLSSFKYFDDTDYQGQSIKFWIRYNLL